MGWSDVDVAAGSTLFAGVESERFYFVHSYAARSLPLEVSGHMRVPLLAWATHGEPFIATVESGPLCATQFHPEKSGDAGAALLSNWLETLR